MVVMKDPPFASDRWTHVVFSVDGMNGSEAAKCTLYVDGEFQGVLEKSQRFTWNPQNVNVLLGLSYVGGIDDLAMFDRALTADEVKMLYALPAGASALVGGAD